MSIEEADIRIEEMQKIILHEGKDSRSREEWKEYFKAQGYLDDEVDMAHALCDAEMHVGRFGAKVTFVSLVVFAFIFLLVLTVLSNKINADISQLAIAPFLLPMGYFAYIYAQQQAHFGRVLQADFEARLLPPTHKMLLSWKAAGSNLLNRYKGALSPLYQLTYDGRETHFGVFSYTVGSGKNKRTYQYWVFIQKTQSALPQVHVAHNTVGWQPFGMGQDINLESSDFNNKFVIKANQDSEAFEVLNPRLMDAIMRRDTQGKLLFFETFQGALLIATRYSGIGPAFRFSTPTVTFKEYQNSKKNLLYALDLLTDLNDILHREIIDDGQKRNPAKTA